MRFKGKEANRFIEGVLIRSPLEEEAIGIRYGGARTAFFAKR
jgi:hypothetical protein